MLLVDKGVVIGAIMVQLVHTYKVHILFNLVCFFKVKIFRLVWIRCVRRAVVGVQTICFFSSVITFFMTGPLDFRYILLSSVCEGLTVCEGNGCWGSES